MTVPFGPLPGDPDVEGVDALLDEMLAGLPASSSTWTASDEAVALMEGARRLSVLARRSDAAAASHLVTEPPELQWEEVLHSAYPSSVPVRPHTGLPRMRSRRSSVPDADCGHHAGHRGIQVVAILLLVLTGFTGGWLLGHFGTGTADNPASGFATAAGDESTPISTAFSLPDEDLSYVSPPICEIASPSIDAREVFCLGTTPGLRMPLPDSMAHQQTDSW